MKKYLEQIMQNKDVKGAKIFMSGRLDGNEIARREHLSKGSLPLQTLRADMDYGTATAFTTYGTIGIRVWILQRRNFNKNKDAEQAESDRRRGPRDSRDQRGGGRDDRRN